jgi:hypothetical protein
MGGWPKSSNPGSIGCRVPWCYTMYPWYPWCAMMCHDVPWSIDPIWSIVQARALPGAAAPAGSQAQGPTKRPTWTLMTLNLFNVWSLWFCWFFCWSLQVSSDLWTRFYVTPFCCRMLSYIASFMQVFLIVSSGSLWVFLCWLCVDLCVLFYCLGNTRLVSPNPKNHWIWVDSQVCVYICARSKRE